MSNYNDRWKVVHGALCRAREAAEHGQFINEGTVACQVLADLAALAERPAEPDLPSVEALAAELRAQVGDTTRTGQEVEACRALDAIKALRQSGALAGRPAEPELRAAAVALHVDDGNVPETFDDLSEVTQRDKIARASRIVTAALAERPAEPEPEEALVAALMAGEIAQGPLRPLESIREEAERLAAVAQAHIDAAVNAAVTADRDRIRAWIEQQRTPGLAPRELTVDDVVEYLDRDTGGQR